ncbi:MULTISPECIES: ABC transporter permease subunit [Devosia]|uniref:sn-glycerol-3-phosphate transport system permease protein UgpE n=1 Tax=Devosia equisanguinis TaxID=2490941 RepID=A0A3S4EKY5_9HYPH|nr:MULTISPECIES: ABC transporter permease subunit [Devosia]ODT48856.1 MAG: ABC transporter permease [Pelagibacterium sp. SCN 63-126]ODU86856.1 MAG: ABC transporter permease [Pelagibacterium sp. SCN 63-17]OJX44216.1 MAG: ABC transporter permease [Devosia sp. 63-57]VDS04297.1 L-arabinose transport system permease protein AraQ [Devosia equisanguinis]
MIERSPIFDAVTYLAMAIGAFLVVVPFWITLVAGSQSLQEVSQVPINLLPSSHLWENLQVAWARADLGPKMINSFIVAVGVTVGKIVLASLSAFAIVFFNFRGRMISFWLIFITLMLPLEVRIVPTYAIAANAFLPFQVILDTLGITGLVEAVSSVRISLEWNLLNSYTGLILPLVATATGTFLYRQFFMTIPDELVEASKMDGASPVRFFFDVLLPLSRTNMLALATIMFVSSWNQYLWPLLITTDRATYGTVVMQLKALIPAQNGTPDWNVTMAGALIIMLPPLLVVAFMQRWFVRGLITRDK